MILSATPAFAKHSENENEHENKRRDNSAVNFTNVSDSTRIKTLENGNMMKFQFVGKPFEMKKLKNDLNFKYRFNLNDDDDGVKIRIPKGTNASSSAAFVAAVKTAYQNYIVSLSAARQAFLTAINQAKANYLNNTTPSPTTTVNPPTIAVAATANPSTVNGTTSVLSVLGADDGGESGLNYTWSIASKPASAPNPSFSANSNNAAKTTTVTFGASGTYQFNVSVSDTLGQTVVSSVTLTVNQTLSHVMLSPAAATISTTGTSQFTATSTDQFGLPQASNFTWAVLEGSAFGSISTAGLYTPTTATGTFHIKASSTVDVTKAATSQVTVNP